MRQRLSSFLLGCLLAVSATAQTTFTWSGLGPINNQTQQFDTAANWVGGVVPGSGDNLIFGAGPTVFVDLATSRTLGDITFSGITNGIYLTSLNSSTLTLNGNVSTTAGAQYWGLFSLPVVLAAGNHTYTAGASASLYHFSPVSGTGGIIKEGPNGLYFTQSNTYSGGTVLNAGSLHVGADYALGFGTVTLNAGTLRLAYAKNDVTLGNNFVLGANVNIDLSEFFEEDGTHDLTLGNGDGSDITPAAGVTTVNFHLTGPQGLLLTGDMHDGDDVTTYTFATSGGGANYYELWGGNDYTGGTEVQSGATLIFRNPGAIPLSGLITSESDSLVGITSPLALPILLSRLDPVNFTGTIGLGNDQTYTDAIDLSAFAGSVALGTPDSAELTGLITPSLAAGEYRFSSRGNLYLSGTNPLTGAYDVVSTSLPGDTPGYLVLRQSVANTYTGDARADGAAIVFDSATSLSATTAIVLSNGGYVSVTETSGLSLAMLVDGVNAGTIVGSGVIGFDSTAGIENGGGNYTYAGAVDFSSLTQDVYLGTATSTLTFSGTLTTAQGGAGDYYLTGYRYGRLRLTSQLTGTRALRVGSTGGQFGTVYLDQANNTFTEGIYLNAGTLIASAPGALGTGFIISAPISSDQKVNLEISGGGTVSNILQLDPGELIIYFNNGTLAGPISGSGNLTVASSLTLTGTSTHDGLLSVVDRVQLTATGNTSLGNAQLSLIEGSSIIFTSAAPSIGSLLEGTVYFDDTDGLIEESSHLRFADTAPATLTINQDQDGDFEGFITQGAGTGSLVKNGAGSLRIGGFVGDSDSPPVPYSGGTTINAGRLTAGSDTALGTGTITINGGELAADVGVTLTNAITFGANGGRLGGNGTFSTPITAGTNVTLAPGASPGVMTFNAGLTLAPGGSLQFEVQFATGIAGVGYDLVNVSAGLLDITATSGSPFTIQLTSLDGAGNSGNVADFSAATGYTWMIFQGNSVSGINGFSADKFVLDTSLFTNPLNGGGFSLSTGFNGGNPALYLNFSPVPEPSTYALLAAGLVSFLGLRRRRRA